MFGMGIFEILVILIVAVIFLGPDKLPQAMVDVVKFFKAVKKTLNDAKETFDKELHINEMKQEVLEYKSQFESNIDGVTKDIQLKEIDAMFKEYKQEEKQPALFAQNTQENPPKKRGRKPKNPQESGVKKTSLKAPKNPKTPKPNIVATPSDTITPKLKKPVSKENSPTPQKTRAIAPKQGKSVGFKRNSKTPKES